MAAHKLTAKRIAKLKPGKHADGGGLYLYVEPTGARRWVYRYQKDHREHYAGLGSYPDVSLAAARVAAMECRELRRTHIDPIEHRKRAESRGATVRTFAAVATEYIDTHATGWKSPKHTAQWRSTLASTRIRYSATGTWIRSPPMTCCGC